jgi:hypothetical protein
VLSQPGDGIGPFEVLTFDFEIVDAASAVTVDVDLQGTNVSCDGPMTSGDGGSLSLTISSTTTGQFVGSAGLQFATSCSGTSNTAGMSSNCALQTFRATASGRELASGTYKGTLTWSGGCTNTSSGYVAPVNASASISKMFSRVVQYE